MALASSVCIFCRNAAISGKGSSLSIDRPLDVRGQQNSLTEHVSQSFAEALYSIAHHAIAFELCVVA